MAMQIKKETIISAVTTDGRTMEIGKTYAFDIDEGRCLIGVYQGLTKRGALSFESIVSGAIITFNIMPKCIKDIKEVEVN